MSSGELHHLSIYMIEGYVTSLRSHHSCDDHLSHAVRLELIEWRKAQEWPCVSQITHMYMLGPSALFAPCAVVYLGRQQLWPRQSATPVRV